MLKLTVWLLFVGLPLNICFAQLAGDKNRAQSLLDDALLALDELSTSYCARFDGTHSEISQSSVDVMDVKGVSAVSSVQAASYRSWGFMHQLKPQQHFQWLEILRVQPGITLSKVASERNRGLSGGGETERPRDLEKNPGAVSMIPQLDPFGLVFGSEYELIGRNSDFAKRREELMSAELVESTQNSNRDAVGRWMGRNKKYMITIVFDRNANNMPASVAFHTYDQKEKKIGKVYGGSRTEWQRYGKVDAQVPKKITIFTAMPDGRENETDLYWTWLDSKKWDAAGIDFESLSKSTDWHTPFDNLFEGSTANSK